MLPDGSKVSVLALPEPADPSGDNTPVEPAIE
jgi:hypothetical protein